MFQRIFLLFSLSLVILTCSDPDDQTVGHDYTTPITALEECISYEFEIHSLPYNQLTRVTYSAAGLADTSAARDDEGIRLLEFEGKLYYQPVTMCHVAYELVAAYRDTGDTIYINQAIRYTDRLVRESLEHDGAIYYPYSMDYKVHRRDDGLLKAPWYSGMAQGEILGLLARMFWATGDSLYLEYADKTFASFLRLRGEAEPWTVFIDRQGCYWIEEYPTDVPTQTLNGFIYAVFGLYDYYLLRKQEQVRKVLNSSLSTLKNYIPLYRRPGKASFYNLRFRHWSKKYHLVHIRQFRQLFRITGDEFFTKWAEIFEQDFSEKPT